MSGPRLAIIGCGLVGNIHRERLLAAGANIVALSDPDADALARLAARLPRRPKLFRSETDLLASGLAEGAALCTPHGQHAAQIDACLDAGVSVLCEKPFVAESEAARQLVEKAAALNKILYVSFTRRGRGHARFLEQAARRIGPIRHATLLRSQPWREKHQRTWRMHPELGGGFLLDNGASLLDLLARFMNEPCVRAEGFLRRRGGVEVDVECEACLTFASSASATLTLLGDAPEITERILLFGEHGTAAWSLREDAPPELYVRPTGGPTEPGDPADHRTLSPDEAFVIALQGGCPEPIHDAATALPAIEMVEKIQQSARWE
jgi:predicted dehydrogenase